MPQKLRFYLRGLVCVSALALVTGCQVSSFVRTQTLTQTKWGDSHRSHYVSGEMTRTMEHSGKVLLSDGEIVYLSPGCVIRLSEEKSGRKTVAEVREKDGKPELWVKAGEGFQLADASKRAWLEEFLGSMGGMESDASAVESEIRRRMENPEDIDFLSPLGRVSSGSDKVAVLERVIGAAHLSARQQVVMVHACFEHLAFSSERKAVLWRLSKRSDFSTAAKKAMLARASRLSLDSQEVAALKARGFR